jgi:ribosomal subunit interface protein
MKLIVKGQQIDVGDALREHVRLSLDGVFDKYFGDAIDATVTFSRDAHFYRASVSAHVGRGIMAQSEATADQPYAAFDQAGERLAKRLRRHKRRLRDHHKMPVETLNAGVYVLAADAPDGESAEDADRNADGERGGNAPGSRRWGRDDVRQSRPWGIEHGLSPPRRQRRLGRSPRQSRHLDSQ